MRFDGTRVLITGGGSGIGLATARAFVAEGARVAINGRDEAKLRAAAKSLPADRLMTRAGDVSDSGKAKALVDHVSGVFGDIDVLVNNAGTNIPERAMRELTPEHWQSLIRANLDTAFNCTWAV